MGPAWRRRIAAFADEIGLAEEHHELLAQALTHRSLGEEAADGDNERLEFLGDTVLALIVCEYLYRSYPSYSEGQLTKLKQRYVSEPSLADAAAALNLGALLAIAPADEATGGRERPSTLSDAFEAVLAAVYLARGLDAAREFVSTRLIARVNPDEVWDFKSRLQELCQERFAATPYYRSEASSGPAHAPIFKSEVLVAPGDQPDSARVLGEGTGRSKKVAEQEAARAALAQLEKPRRKRRKKEPAGAN
jgi:ribonuclease-3